MTQGSAGLDPVARTGAPDPGASVRRGPIARGAGARRRVLQAALEVLDQEGLPRFTMEAIARRAGASKATLYRHWPTSGALLVDAMDASHRPFSVPDTGRVDTDLAELLSAQLTLLEHPSFPRRLAAFMAAAERDPALATLHTDLTHRRREPVLTVLGRARDRGELRPDIDPELLTDLLASPFFYRRFIAHRPIPGEMINEVIAQVLAGARPDQGP